jgi:hypothetical protein
MTGRTADLAAEWLAELAAARLPPASGLRAVGLGWATVDLERGAAELAATAPGQLRFGAAADDATLGARCRVAPGLAGDLSLVLLEPSTEGRLAAALARTGEGPVAGWFEGPHEPDALALSRSGAGPLGAARLVLGGSRSGPFALILGG